MDTTTPVNAEERSADVAGMSYLAIDQYQREVAWIEPISDAQQELLLARVARAKRVPEHAHYALLAGDARDRLVEQYQPLVLRMARRWVRLCKGMEVLDLVNEGSIGLMEAIEQYEQYPGFHGHFPSLAVLCIRHALWEACTYRDDQVVLPARLQSLLSKMRKASTQFEQEHGHRPSSADLASLLGSRKRKCVRPTLSPRVSRS
jgi:RNA polymerase primary sigma factor